jgi:hypothetical protein
LRTPDWSEVRAFLGLDGWTEDGRRSTDHDYFEKRLTTGETLVTRVSRAGHKTMSAGRFKAILADQLRISETQFWEVLRSRRPTERPSPDPLGEPRSLPLWLVQQLERAGVPASRIATLDETAARARLDSLRSRRPDDR